MTTLRTTLAAALMSSVLVAPAVQAKDSVTIGMRLEPAPGLDPSTGAAAAISQVTHYNVFESLTRIDGGGAVGPMLAERWDISDDGKTYTFHLVKGVKFHNGADFDATDVLAQFERNGAEKSSNKQKKLFASFESAEAPDPHTVVVKLPTPNSLLPFALAQASAVMLDSDTFADANTNPIGTGPYKFVKWTKGDSVDLTRFDGHRNAAGASIKDARFRFINDATAQVTALLSGELDYMPSLSAPEMFTTFADRDDFTALQGTTEGETILAMNNRDAVLSDVRVRRALMHAINRADLIEGAVAGYGTPIGAHFPPHHPAYVDLTGTYEYDQDKARALLKEAGYDGNLTLTLHLPPPSYARKGGEVIAAMLADVGVTAKIENVEWAQWLANVYKKKAYQLTIISHVEPMDIGRIYANPDYYFGYDSAEYRAIVDQFTRATDADSQTRYLQAAQRKLAEDAPNGFLFQLAKLGVARKGLTGMWPSWPAFINEVAALRWQ